MPQDPKKATPEVAEAIKSWLAERVSRAKRLDGGVHFIDAIPKNPVSSKIDNEGHNADITAVWQDYAEAVARHGCAREHQVQAVEEPGGIV